MIGCTAAIEQQCLRCTVLRGRLLPGQLTGGAGPSSFAESCDVSFYNGIEIDMRAQLMKVTNRTCSPLQWCLLAFTFIILTVEPIGCRVNVHLCMHILMAIQQQQCCCATVCATTSIDSSSIGCDCHAPGRCLIGPPFATSDVQL
jgi:hypothetical protein